MNIACAGLIFDDSIHYIDHLAPFCALMGWQLIVCDESVAELCRKFYPMTEVIHTDFSQLKLPPCIVSCNTRPSITLALGPLSTWQGRIIWLPHGWSDKGWKSPFFEALESENLLLVYGKRMREVLRTKNIMIPQLTVGDFRWQFYQIHRSFYNRIMESQFLEKEFILYAPTWEDSDQNSSFWEVFQSLIHAVPTNQQLLIKIHPNMLKKSPAKIEQFKSLASKLPHVTFLDEFPPIYPLLDRAQAYVGDMSSIGYDFLRFDKPLFFLTDQIRDSKKNPCAYLMQFGEQFLYKEAPKIFEHVQVTSRLKSTGHEFFEETNYTHLQNYLNEWLSL